MATVGVPGQPVDVLAGHDVDARTGRLLTVAELQRALVLASPGADGRSRRVAGGRIAAG